MKNLIFIISLIAALNGHSQTSLKTLLNFPVGGTWISQNANNDDKPESFSLFYMQFKPWSSESSVLGSIYGIRNSGDTLHLIEVWNFMEAAGKSAFFVQRTTWGEKSVGSVTLYKDEHLDIQFESTTSSGEVYFTRDIHYVISENEMKAMTYQKRSKDDEWVLSGESTWKRIKS